MVALSDIFCDPLDPARSIQLNNRYWPGQQFRLLGIIGDAEALLQVNRPHAAARQLERLKEHFRDARYFSKFLHRVHRLYSSRSRFGYVTGRIELPLEIVEANRYRGSDSRASYELARADAFATLRQQATQIYRREYGSDLLKVNSTVRFARPDEREADITLYGPLSDYHNDEYKGISTIVYLSEVREETGAFCLIAGSNLVPRSLVLTAIHQSVEFDMGLSGPDKLAGLPLEFRGSMALGNYLDEDKLAVVHGHRQVMEGGIGTFVIFNGQYLLHRGGKPVSGSRTAAFLQPEGMLRLKLKGIRSVIYGMTRR